MGFFRRQTVWEQYKTVHVHPITTPIPSVSFGPIHDLEGLATNDVVDSDLSFHTIRDYVPGDSRRHVHWKSTAKVGHLVVRQYEESRQSRVAVILDCSGEHSYSSSDEFELAVSVAASVAAQAVHDKRELVVVTNSPLVSGHKSAKRLYELSSANRTSLLDDFAELNCDELADPLENVSRLAAKIHTNLSTVFVITGSRLHSDRLYASSHASGQGVRSIAVRCDVGAYPIIRRVQGVNMITLGALSDLGKLIARGAVQ